MDVDRFLEGYKERLDEALEIGVGRRRKKKAGKTKHLIWCNEVYQAICNEKQAFWKWKHDQENVTLRHAVRHAKRMRKNAIRKHRRKQNQITVTRIEALRSKDPKEYWKQLKTLDQTPSASKQL